MDEHKIRLLADCAMHTRFDAGHLIFNEGQPEPENLAQWPVSVTRQSTSLFAHRWRKRLSVLSNKPMGRPPK